MRITVGAPPLGSDFYEGRQIVVQELSDKLQRNDVIVIGPRRTGKTCTIQEYLRQQEEAGSAYRGIYVDLQTAQNLYEFYLRILKKVLNTASRWKGVQFDLKDKAKELSNSLGEILSLDADLSPYLGTDADISLSFKMPKFEPSKVEQLAKKLKEELENLGTNVTLVLDEFPELIWKFGKDKELEEQKKERKELTEYLLGGFRSLRQEGGESRRFRIVIAGSVNLHSTLQHLELTKLINDIDHLAIPLLLKEQTKDLFFKLAESESFEMENRKDVEHFLEKQFGECSPYYIQLFADILRQEKIRNLGKLEINKEALKSSYKNLLTDGRGPKTLKTRIEKYYEGDAKDIKSILKFSSDYQYKNDLGINENELFKSLDAINERELFNEYIGKLKCDGLITFLSGDRLGFRSQLFCNMWNYTLGDSGEYLK